MSREIFFTWSGAMAEYKRQRVIGRHGVVEKRWYGYCIKSFRSFIGEYDRYEYQTYHDENTVTPGWSDWEPIPYKRVQEIQGYIDSGYKYRLRGLKVVYVRSPAGEYKAEVSE